MPQALVDLRQVKTHPIIAHFEHHALGSFPDADVHPGGFGVFGNVRQGFLADMEQDLGVLIRQYVYVLQILFQTHIQKGIGTEFAYQAFDAHVEILCRAVGAGAGPGCKPGYRGWLR